LAFVRETTLASTLLSFLFFRTFAMEAEQVGAFPLQEPGAAANAVDGVAAAAGY